MIGNGFIRDIDGSWYTLNQIDHFVIEGDDTSYYIQVIFKRGNEITIRKFKTRKNAQDSLDDMMRPQQTKGIE